MATPTEQRGEGSTERMDSDEVKQAEEEFKVVKSRRARKRRSEEQSMDVNNDQKRPKRPHFPPLKGEKLLVSLL